MRKTQKFQVATEKNSCELYIVFYELIHKISVSFFIIV